MADVFISYKRADRAWAERISEALRDAGVSCWWDTSLVAGEHFNQAIDRELRGCRCVLVIWSEAAHDSRWVQAEALQGFERGILVATRIEDVKLGYPFSVVDSMDLRKEAVEAVVSGIQARLGAPAAPRRRKFKLSLPVVAGILCLIASVGLLVLGLPGLVEGDGDDPIPQAVSFGGLILCGLGAIALFEIVSRRSSLVSAFGGAAAAIGALFISGLLGSIVASQYDELYASETHATAVFLYTYTPITAVLSVLLALAVRRRR